MMTIVAQNTMFDISKLSRVADLIYYDGPLLSHYISDKGEHYLFYWVDVDTECNRWIVIHVDEPFIQQYLDKKITLRSIITQPVDGFVYVVDIDDCLICRNIKKILLINLPESYLPSSNSFYSFGLTSPTPSNFPSSSSPNAKAQSRLYL